MTEAIFWGGVLRFTQAFLAASPTIVVGLFVMAVFRRLMGYESVRTLFGSNSWRALPQAWGIGMLLPVCSLGAIPIVREMRKAGISGGTILAFALAAPLFNPLSILYGLTLSRPLVIFSFAGCSLVIVTLIGLFWDRLFPGTETSEPPPAPVAYGLKRLFSLLTAASREIAGPSLLFIVIGLTGVVLLNVLLPPGVLQGAVNGDNAYAPLTMTGVSIPAYATPMLAMSQLGMMFQHGNSVGAAFVLLSLGTGLTFGTIAWMGREFGWLRGFVWLLTLVVIVLGLAYAVDKPLYPTDIEPADHTHAFDIYCRPYHADTSNLAERTWIKISQDIQAYEIIGAAALGGLLLFGLCLQLFDRRQQLEAWLEKPVEQTNSRFDIVVPGPVLGMVALATLVGMSVVGCFAYYPPQEEVFEEMGIAHAEALTAARTGDTSHALHWIPIWDDWTRRLQVGVYLRDRKLSRYHAMKAQVFRFKLELLEHELEENDPEEIQIVTMEVSRAYRRMQYAYQEERDL